MECRLSSQVQDHLDNPLLSLLKSLQLNHPVHLLINPARSLRCNRLVVLAANHRHVLLPNLLVSLQSSLLRNLVQFLPDNLLVSRL